MTIKHLYPTQRPSLDLNFAQTKRLDPRVDFERFSVGTYVGNDGLIKYAVDHEPRFDHDPVTGESLGLLVEEGRTNIVLHSEDFSNAYWTKNISGDAVAPNITPNDAIAPDGTLSAPKIDFNRATAAHPNLSYVSSGSISTVQGSSYSGGLWVKAATGADVGKKVVLRHVSGGAGIIHTLTSDWKRIDSTETAYSTSAKLSFGLLGYFNGAYGAHIQPETSLSIHVWGAQLEAGSFPTSYIPTDGTPGGIQRAADVVSITGSNFSSWYNQSEGSFLFSHVSPNTPSITTYFYLVTGSSGSTVNGYRIANNAFPALSDGANGWSSVASWLTTGLAADEPSRLAFAFTDGSASTVKNGVVQETNTESLAAVTPAALTLASNVTATIARLAYYPQRLPDATLQALTT